MGDDGSGSGEKRRPQLDEQEEKGQELGQMWSPDGVGGVYSSQTVGNIPDFLVVADAASPNSRLAPVVRLNSSGSISIYPFLLLLLPRSPYAHSLTWASD